MTKNEQEALENLNEILSQDDAMEQVEDLYACKLSKESNSGVQWERTNLLLFKALTAPSFEIREGILAELVSYLLREHLVALSACKFGTPSKSKCANGIVANNKLIDYLNKANKFRQSLGFDQCTPENPQ